MNNTFKTRLSKMSVMLVMSALLLGVSLSIIQIVRSAALDPGHAWSALDDSAAPLTKGGSGQTTASAAFNAVLPSQTGNSGKFLTTDASNSSWGTPQGTTTRIVITGRSSASLSADAYCNPFGSACAASNATLGALIPFNGTIKNLYGYMSAAQGSGDSCVFYVSKATDCTGSFSNTALTCNIGNGQQSCSDISNSAAISSGECLQIFFDEAGTSCVGYVSWSFELQY